MGSPVFLGLSATAANLQDFADAATLQQIAPPSPAVSANSTAGDLSAALPQDQFVPSAASATLDSTALAAGLFTVNHFRALATAPLAADDRAAANNADTAAANGAR